MSAMALFRSTSLVRLVACSSPVKLVMVLRVTSSSVKRAMSSILMAASRALPRAFLIACRMFGSGMFTDCGGGGTTTWTWSNLTVTPLLRRVGRWVVKDTVLRGFPVTSTVSPFPNPVFATRGQRSDIALFSRYSSVSRVNLARGEMSDMKLLSSLSAVRLVNLARGEMLDMELFQRLSAVNRVNPARGEIFVMLFCPSPSAVRLVNPVKGEMLDIKLSRRSSDVRFVNLAIVEMLDMELAASPSSLRLVACSSPVKLRMFSLVA